MYQCKGCKKKFTEEPIYSITDHSPYCSEECLSEDAFDQLYSFEYFSLISSYRYFVEMKSKIDTFEDRINLENEMDMVIEEYKSLYMGDDEQSFYKAEIQKLFVKLLKLYDEVHNIFLTKEVEKYYAVCIVWDEITQRLEMEMVKRIYTDVVDALEENDFSFRNLSWCAVREDEIDYYHYKDTLCFNNAEDQELFYQIVHDIIRNYYNENPKEIDQVLNEGSLYSYIVRKCPVCEHWENEDNFVFDQERNVYVCNQSRECVI